MYQLIVLKDMSTSGIANLLKITIETCIGTTSGQVLRWDESRMQKTGMVWLRKVWEFVHQYPLSSLSHLHLIPSPCTNELYRVSTTFIVKSSRGCHDVPTGVCRCLGYLDIVVLEPVPAVIDGHKDVRNYILLPTLENVLHMLEKVQMSDKVSQLIQTFNNSISHDERSQFVEYISGYSKMNYHDFVVNLLSAMNLFKEKNSGRNVSVNQVRRIAETEELPVKYHIESLDCSDRKYRNLANLLNVPVIQKEDVIIGILGCLMCGTHYGTDEKNKFMTFLLNNLNFFQKRDAMVNIVQNVQFVYNNSGQVKRVSELFDPEDESLKLIIVDRNQFPRTQNITYEIKILRKLGLKSTSQLTGEDLLACAKYIHNNFVNASERVRSDKLLEILQRHSSLLHGYINGRYLYQHLGDLRFIQPSQRRSEFPASLPWFDAASYCRPVDILSPKYSKLVGSVKPVLQNQMSSELSACFGWNTNPAIGIIIEQLFIITERYEDRNKPELLPVISEIYLFLAGCSDRSPEFQQLQNHKWIWTGNGFKTPDRIYLQTKPSDVSLKPYLFLLPSEFQISKLLPFFKSRKCIDNQNTRLLITVLEMIKVKYENGSQTEASPKTDMQLIVKILSKLKELPEEELVGVLVPIRQPDDNRIILKLARECNFCKEDDDIYGEEVNIIHPDISPDTAAKLGVPSLTETLLEDAERLEEWGQNEPLTRRIKDLLKAYTDGFSVPKEIIQNADDASATKVCFMYDERENYNYGKKLLDKNMMECQGPALWAYNNKKFTSEDLVNITKVSGATKEADTTKIGKFGLGFCSVYNLTEVPSFVTGDQMVIFDPHYEYIGDALRRKKQPGLKIDLQRNRKILERKSSQFEPFNNVFGCNLNVQQDIISFNGTLFRLPLRTKKQAATSEIRNVPYDQEQMSGLIKIFVEAGGNLLLFTQNVTDIEFYHLPRNEKDPKNAVLLYSVTRETIRTIERPMCKSSTQNRFSVLKDFAINLERIKKGEIKDLTEVHSSILMRIQIEVGSNLSNFRTSGRSSTTSWFITWASGTDRSKRMALESSVKGLLPLASVACPVEMLDDEHFETCHLNQLPFGFYNSGHVFCYLPLPIETMFPVHINGSFAVTSDRRHLSCKTTDDKDSFDSEWNEALMCDAVCNAYILFLENLRFLGINENEEYYKQWPMECQKNVSQGNFGKLQMAFYKKISDEKTSVEVFRRGDNFVSIKNCKFIDPELMETELSNIVFDVCIKLLDNTDSKLMKLPEMLKNCFRDADCESIINARTLDTFSFYSQLVFPHLTDDVWDDPVKNFLILYALDHHESDKMSDLLKANACIPTLPDGLYRRPCEIVNNIGQLKDFFSIEDQRFVVQTKNAFMKPSRLATLSKLGMIANVLSDELLVDRAYSVQNLSVVCSKCALDRCTQVVKYLIKDFYNINQKKELLTELRSIQFLPVKRRPTNWKWTWGGDKVENVKDIQGIQYCCKKEHKDDVPMKFECPFKLYSQSVEEMVCSLHPVLDKNLLPHDVYSEFLTVLGIKSEVNIQLAFQNLTTFSQDVDGDENISEDLQVLNNTTFTLYKYIDSIALQDMNVDEQPSHWLEVVEMYREVNVILLNGKFVKPSQVAINMSEDCSPLLYGLNKADHFKKLKGFLNLLGIEERHSSKRILSELDMLKTKHGQTKMEENDVKLYVRLLRVLVDCLKLENLTSDLLVHLYIPDTNGILNPIHRLCLDEIDINSTEAMLFTHPSISPDIAVPLGVNTKREQKVKECSKPLKLYSKEFGQNEELITRIKRILSGYPCDAGILKELVQNADDANANEVHIVLDFSSHPTDNLFSESWEPLQGPAILVYNDSCFSETDIVGIQSLGVVSKGDDTTKTGQYGVGFNAVYHITDVPSFLTRGLNVESGESLCVMDPHCNYVPDATHQCPGRQYLNTKLLKEDHPNVFSCYHEDLIMNESGTIFRLPLRTNKFKSKLSNHHINEKFIRELVSDFKNEMSEMLLFVNNVKSIKVSEIVDGHLEEKYSVTLNMSGSDESKRLTFYNAIENGARKISENHNPVYGGYTEINYTLTVKNSCGERSKWLIVRRMGFSGKCSLPENVLNAYANGEIGLLPRGGVALLLEHVAADDKNVKFKKELGRAFCFLPLPLETGLPVHVNGHFSLDHEARRNLWTDDKEGYRSAWNKHLISDVIVPCYVSALHRLKYILCFDLENKVLPLDVFHGFFPNMGKVENIFKFLVCSFYQWIYTNEENIFPCCKLINKDDAKITFYPIKSEAFVFPCVFNTLKEQDVSVNLGTIPNVSPVITDRVSNLRQSTERKPSQDKDLAKLVQICKDIGIKLVESPEQIFKSMKEADIPVVEMTPDFFISFLKSHDTTHEDRFRIEQLGQSLEHTTIQKLKICIKYCQRSTTFSEQMENLPLCLTNDNVLRAFNSGSPVFCSVYCSLLQESSSHFLHYDCVDMFKCEQPGLKDFDINGFIQYLPDTLNSERYRTLNRPVEWNPDSTSKPNMEWISKVWKCFTSVVCKQHMDRKGEPSEEREEEMNSETILNLLHPALHWCLIPTIQNQPTEENISNQTCGNILVPACEARCIIDISTFSGTMKSALESLNLPIMDKNMHLEYDNILEHLVVKRNSPIGLLNMLYKCRDLIESRVIKPEYCLEIMDFFSDHLNSKNLANCSDEDVFKKLKGIPLHVSVSGDHTDIPSIQSVLVMDDIAVTDGIAEWAMHSSTLLLRTTHKLTNLYQKLGFTDKNLKKIDLYRKHLLPKFRFLPQENHLVHLRYTRDVLLAKPCGQDFNDEQNSLISILQSVAFIPNSDGELSTASCFKHPRKKLMRLMFPESAFPTGVYREKEWNDFLSIVGMQCEITSEMIVQFARDIANAGENGITEDNKKDLENKSKKLLHHIYLCSTVDVNLFKTLCEIKFIPPFKVTKWKADIYPQPDADFLICFRNSTVRAVQGLCWTKCHIIPYWADPRNEQHCEKKKEMFDLLEIQLYPTYENVIHHMQNICESLKRTEISDIFAESVENLMSSMYTFLMSKLGESDNRICLERGLSKMPVLYLPEQKMFVACNRVVKSINENEIIKPYLMEIPDKYHQFFELFEVLGMDRQVNVCNFVRVLALLKIDVNNDQLHINELQIVKQAIQRLFHYLQIFTTSELVLYSVETLYLLSQDNTLKDAKCLVYSDNTDFEEKIGDDIGMPYVASLDKLGVRLTGSFAKEFKKLPKHLQPNILSSLVSRQLQERFELLSLDENGLQLVALLSSPQFHQAVVRIAVHSRKTIQGLSPLELNEGVVNTWIENIQNIQVIQVKSCKLNLVFKDTVVGNEEVSCYYQKKKDNDDQNILYCAFKETDIKDWLQESSRVIEYAISHCTERKFVDSGALLLKILLKIYNIDEMSVLLDREKVDEFCISVDYNGSMFPSPGMTVHPDWHRFLDNSFSTFDPNEYVALLLSEEQMNKDEYTPSVYVYAIIIRKCETTDCESNVLRNTLQMYEVRVGRGRIEQIHAFDLYKFNRNFKKTSKEIAPFIDIASNSSTDSRPLEDILREVEDTIRAAWSLPEDERRKIIKRLYKKWHPDKNFGNELVATEVFKFIKQAVLNIERGNDINTRYDSQDFNDFSRDSQFWNHFQTWDQDTRHTTNQAPAAGTSGNENQSAHTRGRQCYEPVPSSADAKQWMHQAKRDFSAASQFLVEAEKGHNFNWICFLCQQVNYCTCYWKCLYCLFFQGFI